MTAATIAAGPPMSARHHVALHLAHRWFAFFEAPGGNLDAHLTMFHPQVRLSGSRSSHVFARDRGELRAWFATVPDAVSSHHIVHSTYSTVSDDAGLLSMVVAYQAPGNSGMHGSIISYQTRIEFAPDAARFTALDKTPILADTRPDYETSWAANRVLARVHAELGGIAESNGHLLAALGSEVRQVFAQVTAPEGSDAYEALVTASSGHPGGARAVHLKLTDDVQAMLPMIEQVSSLASK